MTQDLEAVIARLDAIEWGLRNAPKAPKRDPVNDLARDVFEDVVVSIAGDFARELTGRRKRGTKFAKRELAHAAAARKSQTQADERQRYLNVLDTAESLVNANDHRLSPQSIASLRREAMSARNAERPTTVSRRTLAYLGRARVAIQGALQLPTPSAMLTQLERALRETIKNALSAEQDWWRQRIPSDVRERAEKRADGKPPLIDYVDFHDYLKIITQKNNWDQHFRKTFPNRDWLTLRLIELGALRNEIAHSRPISYDEAMKFRVLSNDVLDRLVRKG